MDPLSINCFKSHEHGLGQNTRLNIMGGALKWPGRIVRKRWFLTVSPCWCQSWNENVILTEFSSLDAVMKISSKRLLPFQLPYGAPLFWNSPCHVFSPFQTPKPSGNHHWLVYQILWRQQFAGKSSLMHTARCADCTSPFFWRLCPWRYARAATANSPAFAQRPWYMRWLHQYMP